MKKKDRSTAEIARAAIARDLVSKGEISPEKALLMTVFPSPAVLAREARVSKATLHGRAKRER